MRDLFSQCTCVRTYVSVTLRNVNLWFRLGMSICTHARMGNWIHALHNDVGMMFLAYGGRGALHGWPFAMYLRSQVHKRVLAYSWRLGGNKRKEVSP